MPDKKKKHTNQTIESEIQWNAEYTCNEDSCGGGGKSNHVTTRLQTFHVMSQMKRLKSDWIKDATEKKAVIHWL